MAGDSRRQHSLIHSRRRFANLLLRPGLQLKLPLFLLGLTGFFVVLLTVQSFLAVEMLFSEAASRPEVPIAISGALQERTWDFFYLSASLAMAYALAAVGVSVVYLHRLVGPMVAFRRHLEALKNGDYSSRVQLRRKDAFEDVAEDLNELAQILEADAKDPAPTGSD